MRIAARLSGVLLLTVCLAACDTDEVLQLASQNATISFRASGVATHYFDIWEAYEDNDADNMPDAGTTPFLWCVAQRDNFGNFFTTGVLSAPWQHSFRLSILRAGETDFVPITDDMFLDPTSNTTPFDTRVFGAMTAPPPNAIVEAGRTFKFRAYRNERLTALNAPVVAANADANSLHQLNSAYSYGNGLCSQATPAVVALTQLAPLVGAAPPFSFSLGKGDTMRIEAAKSVAALPGIVVTDPALSADFFLDGVNANNFVVGARGTGTGPGEVLSFTYTSR